MVCICVQYPVSSLCIRVRHQSLLRISWGHIWYHVGVKIWPITWGVVKKLFHNDGPSGSSSNRIEEKDKFTGAMSNTFGQVYTTTCICLNLNILFGFRTIYQVPLWPRMFQDMPPDHITNQLTHSYHMCGTPLAHELLRMESGTPTDLLQVIFEVWHEMLCYAANRCSRDSHDRHLSSVGEFITVVWLLARQIHGFQQPRGKGGHSSVCIDIKFMCK